MEKIVLTSSSEASAAANHMRNNEDGQVSRGVQDTDDQPTEGILCNNKTVTEAMISEEVLADDCTEGSELAMTPTKSTAAAANNVDKDVQLPAGDMIIGASNNGRLLDAEQPSVNANGIAQQSDKERSSDVSNGLADPAVNQAKQKSGVIHHLDHPASVVIDLRSPPLVQVCLLHGTDDVGAGGSGSGSGGNGFRRRPQTARRGRRNPSSMAYRSTNAARSNVEEASLSSQPSTKDVLPSATDLLSKWPEADEGKQRRSSDDDPPAKLSTIIHLKVLDTSGEKVTSGQSEFSPVTDDAVTDSQLRLHLSDADSESSNDSMMKVRNVNRTYSRNPFVPADRKNPRLITISKSADDHDGKTGSEVSRDFGRGTRSHRAQEFKSVPKKSKQAVKQKAQIGPAWFSRRFLNAPPPELYEYARTSRTLTLLKRPNYNSGERRLPIVATPPTVKQVFEVPVVEEVDIAAIGSEQLKLWRLSEEDVSELQSQLRQEAEHRRSEHIMPLVMQMTDAQIEDAYEHVAESMKTYEIVEADSDEDVAEEEEESEEDVADDYKNGSHLEPSDWKVEDEADAKEFGETEYSRSRPKRHAVDYGPSAFAPILIMEGRRLFSRQRKSNREPHMKSTDAADGVKLQQRSHGRRRGRKRKKSKVEEHEHGEISPQAPAVKCADNTEDTAGQQRVGLFDGLTQCRTDDSTTATYQATDSNSTEPLHTLPLLIPAKHLAVISAVRSSPPPDLGLPMATADVGTAGEPSAPPVLEPESARAASGRSSASTADDEVTVIDYTVPLTSAAPADSNNVTIVID